MKRYAVHPTLYVSFKAIVEFHRVSPGECVNMSRPDDCCGIDTGKLIHLYRGPETEETHAKSTGNPAKRIVEVEA